MSQLTLDLELALKYSTPGPRYTSYPPATCFTDQVRWPAIAEEVAANNRAPRDLSLYFHIPFCQTLCWFCGCNTVITLQQSQSAIYLGYLEKELARMAPLLHPERKVVQVHLGGGTPTFMQPDEMRRLGELVRKHFHVAADVEAGAELDPRRIGRDHIKALREAGFNRASMGVQDFDPQVQKAVHRIQPKELTAEVVGWIRDEGFQSLNIDLIYGLPYQTVESFSKTLDDILELAPDRLAVFNYAHVPWMKPAQKILDRQPLPEPRLKLQLLKLVIERLTDRDRYVYIGMDHFARPGDELVRAQRDRTLQRNFQGYSTRGGADIYGFGVSSISQTDHAYWQNLKDLHAYYGALDAGQSPCVKGYLVTPDDQIRRDVIMRIMCHLRLNYDEVSRRFGLRFADYFARELESLADLEADGLLRRGPDELEVTHMGRLFIRNIAMRFDAHLPKPSERRFSRTV
jgi:oxygen-independent coproporphyrinogen-3 oxidase